MGQYEPILTMCIVSLSIVIFNKLWRKNKNSQKISYNPNKPQKNFTKYIRDNVKDNLSDFYTAEDFQHIKQKIEDLESESFLETLPNLALKPFKEDDFDYVTQEKELIQLASDIQLNSKVIGIDIEQTNHNSYQGYNCLIQISTLTKNYIIDAILLHDLLPIYLKPICENESIVKVFYSGTSDLQWLNRDYEIFVVNFFDVHYASMFLEKRKDCSLVGLFDQYCNHKLEKETKKKFQVSDWRQRPLTQEQLNYAILDAHYLIYLRNVILEKLKQNKKLDAIVSFLKQMQTNCLKPYEPKPFNKYGIMEFFNQEILPTAKSIRQDKKLKAEWSKEKKIFVNLCKLRDDIARAIDTNPDNVFSIKSLLEISIEPPVDLDSREIAKKLNMFEENLEDVLKYSDQLKSILKEENLVDLFLNDNKEAKKGQVMKQEKKFARREIHENKFALKKDLYENCQVLAPDGEILSFTNHKKIRWYLKKGLAEQIGENPTVIKLKFEPSGREISEMKEMNIDKQVYMKRNRVNQCVVCGKQDKLSRHHVVPVIYRQHFPPQLKNHRAHDVLLMCFRCREKAIYEMDKFKVEIANTYNVPLVEFDKPKQLKLAAEVIQKILSTYVKFKNAMPQDRRRKLKVEIRREFTIFNSDGLSESARKEVESFTLKEDGRVKIDQKFIDFFLNMKSSKGLVQKSSNKDFKNMSGKLIVEKLANEELRKFIDDWRMYFLRVMDPQFLPHDWNLALEQRAKQKQNISQ